MNKKSILLMIWLSVALGELIEERDSAYQDFLKELERAKMIRGNGLELESIKISERKCTDNLKSCENYRSICDKKHPSSVSKHCPATCGLCSKKSICEDQYQLFCTFANNGNPCKKYWRKKNCKKSCNLCSD